MNRLLIVLLCGVSALPLRAATPNVLFLFADDWGRHASIYAKSGGAPGTAHISDMVQTPNFDKIAQRGVLFRNAHVNAPSCTPCRSSLLSGQYFWRTGRGGILVGAVWDSAIPTFPLLLRDQGFHIGKQFFAGGFGHGQALTEMNRWREDYRRARRFQGPHFGQVGICAQPQPRMGARAGQAPPDEPAGATPAANFRSVSPEPAAPSSRETPAS